MIIYRDILTGDEIISDAYDLKVCPDAEGLWEADCKKITVGGESFDTGANASAEGEDADDTQDTAEQVIDVVHSFRLQSIPQPDKKFATSEFKKFAKAVNEKLKADGKTEQAKQFQKSAGSAVQYVLKNLKDLDFYHGESENTGAPQMWAFINYREDGITPFILVFKDAMEEYKV